MSPRETRVLAVALALTGLHVLDDATLHREPGTTVADNLTGAGALLGVLAVSAAVFPRLRAGAQAVLALLLGSFALLLGALHLTESANATAGAWEKASGVALVAIGAVTLVLGARGLWQSRRGGSRSRRYLRRALVAIASLLIAFFVVFPLFFAVGATHKPRRAVEPAELSRPYETVGLPTSDGLELAGWYVPSRNGAAVIAFPGRTGPAPHARMLIEHGYGVLMLDMRGNGESEGNANVFGWGSGKDRGRPRPGRRDAQPALLRAGRRAEGRWLIPEASHTGGLEARPEEYERRVVGFFDRYLLGRPPAPS